MDNLERLERPHDACNCTNGGHAGDDRFHVPVNERVQLGRRPPLHLAVLDLFNGAHVARPELKPLQARQEL